MKLSQRGDCWTISNLILHSKKYSCQSCFSCCGSYATVLLSALCVDNDEDTIKTLTLCLHTLPIYAIPAKCHGTWIMMQTFPLKFTNSLDWDNANRYHPRSQAYKPLISYNCSVSVLHASAGSVQVAKPNRQLVPGAVRVCCVSLPGFMFVFTVWCYCL